MVGCGLLFSRAGVMEAWDASKVEIWEVERPEPGTRTLVLLAVALFGVLDSSERSC